VFYHKEKRSDSNAYYVNIAWNQEKNRKIGRYFVALQQPELVTEWAEIEHGASIRHELWFKAWTSGEITKNDTPWDALVWYMSMSYFLQNSSKNKFFVFTTSKPFSPLGQKFFWFCFFIFGRDFLFIVCYNFPNPSKDNRETPYSITTHTYLAIKNLILSHTKSFEFFFMLLAKGAKIFGNVNRNHNIPLALL
jgi:hypothetical protein